MTIKKEKQFVFSMLTWCSMLLFVLLIVTTTLTPLAETSKAANTFNSVGMYAAIGFILACYLIPYGIYLLGLKSMKYIMAVFCMIGCLIAFSNIFGMLAVFYFIDGQFYDVLIPLIISGLMLCVNVVWLIAAFVKTNHQGQAV